MEENPRKNIGVLIGNNDLFTLMDRAAALHGHYCPGLALGVMAATHAMRSLQADSDGLDDLLAIVETNNCFSDGVQFVTGCSFGNNGLVFHDLGKMAFTLAIRNGKAVRIFAIPGSRDYIRSAYTGFSEQYKTVVIDKDHADNEKSAFKHKGLEAARTVLRLDMNKIFKIEKTEPLVPDYPPSHESFICEKCGEETMSTRTVSQQGRTLCLPCAGKPVNTLSGFGISTIKEG